MSARGYFAERARLSGEGRACPRDMTCQRPINHKGKCDASDPPMTARKPSAALTVRCSTCFSEPGKPCMSWDDGAQKWARRSRSHAGRLIKAKRATPAGREAARRA